MNIIAGQVGLSLAWISFLIPGVCSSSYVVSIKMPNENHKYSFSDMMLVSAGSFVHISGFIFVTES